MTLAMHRTARRTLATSIAVTAAGLLLTPASAFAAGGPGGGKPKGPHPTPKPAGPVQTVTKVSTPKIPTAAKPLTLSARISPAHRSGPGSPAETGTVVFTVDGTASAPVPVAANKASEKLKLSAGKHTVSAKYSGDSAHAASDSGPVSITVS